MERVWVKDNKHIHIASYDSSIYELLCVYHYSNKDQERGYETSISLSIVNLNYKSSYELST